MRHHDHLLWGAVRHVSQGAKDRYNAWFRTHHAFFVREGEADAFYAKRWEFLMADDEWRDAVMLAALGAEL